MPCNFGPFHSDPLRSYVDILDNARISELQPDGNIFDSYDFPKNWLNIIHQPSTIFHILRTKSANQTFWVPLAWNKDKADLLAITSAMIDTCSAYIALICVVYIFSNDPDYMCCLYISKLPWLHMLSMYFQMTPLFFASPTRSLSVIFSWSKAVRNLS